MRLLYTDSVRLAVIVVTILIILGAAWFFFSRQESGFETGGVSAPENLSMSEPVELKTEDGVKIIGDYYPPTAERQISNGESRGVLLLHMMPRDRKSWVSFAEKLQRAGFPVLAIDLRGHGESGGGPDGYKKFSDVEHQASKLDVLEGAKFLRSKRTDAFHIIGASIGANLALEYAVLHPNARSVVLLSPGLDYRGVKTEDAISGLRSAQAVYLVASEEDTYSRDTVNRLAGKISLDERHKLKIFTNAGHGTTMLEKNPEFMGEIIAWLVSL